MSYVLAEGFSKMSRFLPREAVFLWTGFRPGQNLESGGMGGAGSQGGLRQSSMPLPDPARHGELVFDGRYDGMPPPLK